MSKDSNTAVNGNEKAPELIRLENLYVKPRIIKHELLRAWEDSIRNDIEIFISEYTQFNITQQSHESVRFAFYNFLECFIRPHYLLQGYLQAKYNSEKVVHLCGVDDWISLELERSIRIVKLGFQISPSYQAKALFFDQLAYIKANFLADINGYSNFYELYCKAAIDSLFKEIEQYFAVMEPTYIAKKNTFKVKPGKLNIDSKLDPQQDERIITALKHNNFVDDNLKYIPPVYRESEMMDGFLLKLKELNFIYFESVDPFLKYWYMQINRPWIKYNHIKNKGYKKGQDIAEHYLLEIRHLH